MTLFYKDQPVFGFDVGLSSVKIMQIDPPRKKELARVRAYGAARFPANAVSKGEIVQPELIIKTAHELITTSLTGRLSSKHVAVSMPNSHSFSRLITLPADISSEDVESAVLAEIAESIPNSIADLCYDYTVTRVADKGQQEVKIVASRKAVIDSYIQVAEALGLTIAVIEPNINSVSRLVINSEAHEEVSLIVDLGSEVSDLSIYDGNIVRATGTIDCGGQNITQAIANSLGVSEEQANNIKTRYGLEVSKKQAEILAAVEPELAKLISEIRKAMRYYTERASKDRQIGQIIILGGGANLPGLSSYITDKTRIPTRRNSPWSSLSFGRLKPPHELEASIYTTAAGLSLIRPEEITS